MELSEGCFASEIASPEAFTYFRGVLRSALFSDNFTCARVFVLELVELFGIADLLMNRYS